MIERFALRYCLICVPLVVWATCDSSMTQGDNSLPLCAGGECIQSQQQCDGNVRDCAGGRVVACCFSDEPLEGVRQVPETLLACVAGACLPTRRCADNPTCEREYLHERPGFCLAAEALDPRRIPPEPTGNCRLESCGDQECTVCSADETSGLDWLASLPVEDTTVCGYGLCRDSTECGVVGCRFYQRYVVHSLGHAGEPPKGTVYEACLGECDYLNPGSEYELPCTPGAITILEEPATPTAGG